MQKIHTHYDNLKVARNAPLEVIKAAYKALSQKYHPDRNSDSPDATKIMTMINISYEILSNSTKRQDHDLWIIEKEAAATQQNKTHRHSQPFKPTQATGTSITFKSVIAYTFRHCILLGTNAYVAFRWYFQAIPQAWRMLVGSSTPSRGLSLSRRADGLIMLFTLLVWAVFMVFIFDFVLESIVNFAKK